MSKYSQYGYAGGILATVAAIVIGSTVYEKYVQPRLSGPRSNDSQFYGGLN